MICYNCNQKIVIKDGIIKCDICGLEFDGTRPNVDDGLYYLITYNAGLEEARKEGRLSYMDGSKNPYSLESDEIMLNKSWEEGSVLERKDYEMEAFSSSAKNLEELANKNLENMLDMSKRVQSKQKIINMLIDGLRRMKDEKYFFGYKYEKDIKKLAKQVAIFMEAENPDS